MLFILEPRPCLEPTITLLTLFSNLQHPRLPTTTPLAWFSFPRELGWKCLHACSRFWMLCPGYLSTLK